jgi:hypothetical protein
VKLPHRSLLFALLWFAVGAVGAVQQWRLDRDEFNALMLPGIPWLIALVNFMRYQSVMREQELEKQQAEAAEASLSIDTEGRE